MSVQYATCAYAPGRSDANARGAPAEGLAPCHGNAVISRSTVESSERIGPLPFPRLKNKAAKGVVTMQMIKPYWCYVFTVSGVTSRRRDGYTGMRRVLKRTPELIGGADGGGTNAGLRKCRYTLEQGHQDSMLCMQ
jgi:hypothetical protein